MVRIVIEAPDEFKEMVAAIETLAATVQRIAGRATGGKVLDYAAIEREIGAATAGVERTAHQGILRGLDRDVPRIRISGEPYSRVGRYEQTYYTHLRAANGLLIDTQVFVCVVESEDAGICPCGGAS